MGCQKLTCKGLALRVKSRWGQNVQKCLVVHIAMLVCFLATVEEYPRAKQSTGGAALFAHPFQSDLACLHLFRSNVLKSVSLNFPLGDEIKYNKFNLNLTVTMKETM